MKQPKLGSGERFAKLKEKLSHEKGVYNPGGLAAHISREKYGNKKTQEIAMAGKNRKK